jgi:hypothetical protein
MRERLASLGPLAVLIGLGVIGYGAMVYPPLTAAMALANLAFILACIAVAVLDRPPRRRKTLDGGADSGKITRRVTSLTADRTARR